MTPTIERGTKVLVPKGTTLFTTHPGEKHPVTKRDLVVKVHHVLPARRYLLAIRFSDGRLSFQGSSRDQIALCEALGLLFGSDMQIQASLESLVPKATVESPYEHGKVECLWIEQAPSRVVWAGTGGYWREAPINVVTVLPNKPSSS